MPSAVESPETPPVDPRHDARHDARTPSRRPAPLLLAITLAMVACLLARLAGGPVAIPWPDVVRILAGGEGELPAWNGIVMQIRLPKAITASLAGAALAVSGLLMQTLFRNPLAGPFVLGISAGASLGVAIVLLSVGAGTSQLLAGLGLVGDFGLVAAASLGSGLALALVMFAARRVSTLTLLILGVLFGYATSALVTVLIHFSLAERIQSYIAWTFGSFGNVTWSQLQILAPTLVVGLALALATAKPLNALLLGEGYAASMGIEVTRARWLILISTALLAGGVTAFCGPIGFLGIAVPHLVRGVFRLADHRVLIPASAVTGAAVALISDLVAQLPGSQAVLPLNAVTALIGAPIIGAIILRRRLDDSFSR
ncbi:MAG: iron ABC transporter permease [Acidobacteriota bacterium]